MEKGEAEGRHVTFSPQGHLAHNPLLQAAFGKDLHAATIHYVTEGDDQGLLWT